MNLTRKDKHFKTESCILWRDRPVQAIKQLLQRLNDNMALSDYFIAPTYVSTYRLARRTPGCSECGTISLNALRSTHNPLTQYGVQSSQFVKLTILTI